MSRVTSIRQALDAAGWRSHAARPAASPGGIRTDECSRDRLPLRASSHRPHRPDPSLRLFELNSFDASQDPVATSASTMRAVGGDFQRDGHSGLENHERAVVAAGHRVQRGRRAARRLQGHRRARRARNRTSSRSACRLRDEIGDTVVEIDAAIQYADEQFEQNEMAQIRASIE